MTPNTVLQAVNVMLSSAGETPVTNLESQNVEAEIAQEMLIQESRTVQEQGWYFNTEHKIPMVPDTRGTVYLPSTCLRIDPSDRAERFQQRGNILYDPVNHTGYIGRTVYVDMVVELLFENLPPVARRYITIKAARAFQQRIIGSDTLNGFHERDEMQAYMDLKEAEAAQEDFSIFDNFATYRILDRLI